MHVKKHVFVLHPLRNRLPLRQRLHRELFGIGRKVQLLGRLTTVRCIRDHRCCSILLSAGWRPVRSWRKSGCVNQDDDGQEFSGFDRGDVDGERIVAVGLGVVLLFGELPTSQIDTEQSA